MTHTSKRWISFVTALCVLCTAVAVGLATNRLLAATDNYLGNSGFEDAGSVRVPGYNDFVVGRGQDNILASGWYGYGWWTNDDKETAVRITHTGDAHGGSYALRFDIQGNSDSLNFYPTAANVDAANITAGYYTLRLWVKGNNTASSIEISTPGGIYRQAIVPSAGWKQIEMDGVYLTGGADCINAYQLGLHIRLIVAADSSKEKTTLTIDDIALTKSENLLANGSLENASGISTGNGYADKVVGRGQDNLLAAGWYGFNWWTNDNQATAVRVSHVNDAYSGAYSLRFDIKANSDKFTFYPATDALNTQYGEGYYTLSAWVKSSNASATTVVELKTTDGTVYSAVIPAGEEWHQVTLDNIWLSDTVGIEQFNQGYHVKFIFTKDAAGESYVQLDGITLKQPDFLSNPDFESGLSGWSATGAGTAETASDTYTGLQALQVTLGAGENLTVSENTLPAKDLAVGYYMLAFRAKGGGQITAAVAEEKLTVTPSAAWQTFVLKDIPIADGQLNTFEFTFTATDGETQVLFDGIEFYRQVGPGGVIDSLTVSVRDGRLVLPDAPEGYVITVYSSDNEQVIALDGGITPVETETEVTVVLAITNRNDPTDWGKTEPIAVTVTPEQSAGGGEDPGEEPGEEPAETPELLTNGGFEDAGARGQGYSNYTVLSGQGNIIAAGWHGRAWSPITFAASHTSDAYAGDYSLRLDSTGGGARENYWINPSAASVATDRITAGSYTLSVWVKGTATGAYLCFGDREVPIPAGEEWHQVVLEGIELTPDYAFVTENNVNGIAMNKTFGVRIIREEGVYIQLDEISLKQQTARS